MTLNTPDSRISPKAIFCSRAMPNSAKNQHRLEEAIPAGRSRTNTETAVPLPCCSEQLAARCNSLILLAPVRGT
jgi:hypothetical protein